MCNPCRGRGFRGFINILAVLQLLFVVAVFVSYRTKNACVQEVNGQKASGFENNNANKRIAGFDQWQDDQINRPMALKPSPPGKPSIDMVNDYQPFVDFKFEYPEVQPKIDAVEGLFLVVLVNSGAKVEKYRQRRMKIRETWANSATCEHLNALRNNSLKDLKWLLVFVLGKASKEDNKQNIQEAKVHNDMIIGNIEDNYLNNILKFYMGQLWASLIGARYTLKTDDDVYIRVPKVIEYIVSVGSPTRFYGGVTYRTTEVARWPGGKWSISKKYFPEDVFPPFNTGAFILLSMDLLRELMNYVHVRKPFHTDDAYIGVAMRDLKVKVVHILSVIIKNNMGALVHTKDDCYILSGISFGHGVLPGAMEHVHNRIEKLCQASSTIKTLKCPETDWSY